MAVDFTGVLGVIGRVTQDGRRLGTPDDPATRDLPLPLLRIGAGACGRIDRIWVDDDLIRYSGSVDDHEAVLIREKLLVANLDLRLGSVEYPDDDIVEFSGWRINAATLGNFSDRAWPEVCMDLVGDE